MQQMLLKIIEMKKKGEEGAEKIERFLIIHFFLKYFQLSANTIMNTKNPYAQLGRMRAYFSPGKRGKKMSWMA